MGTAIEIEKKIVKKMKRAGSLDEFFLFLPPILSPHYREHEHHHHYGEHDVRELWYENHRYLRAGVVQGRVVSVARPVKTNVVHEYPAVLWPGVR